MANALKDAVAEKIDIKAHLDGMPTPKNYNYWWLVAGTSLTLATVTCAFFLVRRWMKPATV